MIYQYFLSSTEFNTQKSTKTQIWVYKDTSNPDLLVEKYMSFTGTEDQLIAYLKTL